LRSSERHHLKEDQFAAATMDKLSWAVEHRNPMLVGGVILIVALLILIGGFYYQQNREQRASILLGEALQLYSAPIRPAGSPEVPGQPSFTSVADRAKAASNKLIETSEKYGRTDSGTMANYFLGLSAEDMNDSSKAEEYLKKVTDSGNKDLAALAKSALASLYHDTNRDQLAIGLYKQLIEKPTNTVPKSSAQIALADLYAAKDPSQARKIYEEVQKDNADNVVGQVATSKLQGLK
jgi:predicted negative regulator of RcsB-dependent stress response